MWIVVSLIVAFSASNTLGLLDSVQEVSTEQLLQELTSEVQALKQQVTQLQAQVNQQTQPAIAFSAGLTKTLMSIGSDQQTVFDNVITNVGNGYHPTHGHFIAPVRGVYAFFVGLTNIPEHSASAALLKNGAWVGHVLAHGSPTNNDLYVTSTLATTVQLEAGDEVWVQNRYEFSTVEEIDGYNWSFFSGHLVNAN